MRSPPFTSQLTWPELLPPEPAPRRLPAMYCPRGRLEHRIGVELAVQRRRVGARSRRALAGGIAVGDGRRGRRRKRAAHDVAGHAGARVARGRPVHGHGAIERGAGSDARRSGRRRRVVEDALRRRRDAAVGIAEVRGLDLVRPGVVAQSRRVVGERRAGHVPEEDPVAIHLVVVQEESRVDGRDPRQLRPLIRGRRECRQGRRSRQRRVDRDGLARRRQGRVPCEVDGDNGVRVGAGAHSGVRGRGARIAPRGRAARRNGLGVDRSQPPLRYTS